MKTSFKHIAVAFVLALAGSNALPGTASADGTHPNGSGGAVCKGETHCLFLSLECKGTYTDATDSNGTVYGESTKVAKIATGAPKALKQN